MTIREHRQARERELVDTAQWVYENTGSDFEVCLEEAGELLALLSEGADDES